MILERYISRANTRITKRRGADKKQDLEEKARQNMMASSMTV
jgi:hypothetical protein